MVGKGTDNLAVCHYSYFQLGLVYFFLCHLYFQERLLLGCVHVVDDDAAFRTAIERRLKHAGYEVATYASAQHLLDRLPSESVPGCILLDVRIFCFCLDAPPATVALHASSLRIARPLSSAPFA